ncbi:homoserine kinase [Fictibacillus sp. Mic-4]|uniref:homoserine kinase n=1 Tax=Fictibacillus TaxID=1329200 RepID=UPI000415DA30|nr:homoserine kinase [Fictibacillus gelatini]
MSFSPFTVKVPGSTANLGPGFDSVGLAINRYLTMHVSPANEFKFKGVSDGLEQIPQGEDNLVYQAASFVAKKFKKELPFFHVEMSSELPLERGMGSSAAAIVGGIEIANTLLALSLAKKEKAHYASMIEGHPDNVAASVYGGLIIALYDGLETEIVHVPTPSAGMILMVPKHPLNTEHARSLLPKELKFQEAVKASAVSNVLIAAILQDDWKKAGRMMDQDQFHQPYRENLIPHFHQIRKRGKELGCYGVAISGAGPSIVCFAPGEILAKVSQQFKQQFPDFTPLIVVPDKQGVSVQDQNYLLSKSI